MAQITLRIEEDEIIQKLNYRHMNEFAVLNWTTNILLFLYLDSNKILLNHQAYA